MRLAAVLMLAALLTGAGSPLPAASTIDMQHSRLTVYVYKQGLFSFLADNHTIDAPLESGTFDRDRKAVRIVVDAAKMQVLDPKLAPDKRSQVQSNMLGPQVLDVAHYPTIEFQSTSIQDGGNNSLRVSGNLSLHGQTHSLSFDVKSDPSGQYTGSATVRQTAFGITPIKIAGGAVSVRDDVRVEFTIVPGR